LIFDSLRDNHFFIVILAHQTTTMKNLFYTFPLLIITIGCSSPKNNTNELTTDLTAPELDKNSYNFSISEFSDADYPDNPDINFSANNYQHEYFTTGKIVKTGEDNFSFSFFSKEDTLSLANISLNEYIPTIPDHLKGKDDYLCYLSLVNQEWNRNQVRYNSSLFSSTDENITRIDVARNCLNSYLWEIIVYTTENEKEVPMAHGWFDFPKPLYHQLFQKINDKEFSDFQKPLEDWVDPKNQKINRELLRKVDQNIKISYNDLSNGMYPLDGARKKKFKEIIHPKTFETMRDLQNDSTTFATFSPPGLYKRAEPRTTQLGRFKQLLEINVNLISSLANNQAGLYEFELIFNDVTDERTTKLVLGGIDISKLPSLNPDKANKGKSSSMGFGNHPFYETYDQHQKLHLIDNPYYAFLCNEKDEWLDSHQIGIDGPVFHVDDQNPNIIHLWLLSFERHSFVGHYKIELKNQP